MRSKYRRVLVVLVAVSAVSAAVASAASAHAFKARPTGGTFPAAIGGAGGTLQFKSGFESITCEKAKSTGELLSREYERRIPETIEYSGNCKDNQGDAVTEPIKAEYEIFAEETVSILAPIEIKLKGLANCTITLEKQANLGGIKFKNNAAKTELTVESKTTGIKQTGSGGFCTNGTGEFTGSVTTRLVHGGEWWWE